MPLGNVVLALALSQVAAPQAEDPVAAEIHAYLDGIESQGASGVVLVAVGEEVRVRRGFGSANCAGGRPMTAEHLVMIGSITKDLTQLLTYILVERGQLSFDDPLGKYLTELDADKRSITVRQVLDHTAGLPDLVDSRGQPVPYTVEYDYWPVTRDQLIRRAAAAELLFPPGEREEYSNLGYSLLGAVLEIASGERYERLLVSKIFAPAGMSRTGYVLPGWRELPFADGCRRGSQRWGSPLVDEMWDASGPSWNLKAAGGLLSTVDDLARWFGALSAAKLLGPDMNRRYLSDRLVHSDFVDQRVLGSAGSNGIFNAVAYWAETSDLRVAVVTTRADFQAERERVARTVIRAAAGYVSAGAGG